MIHLFYPNTEVVIELEEQVQETSEGFDLQVCVNITEDFEIHISFMLTSKNGTAACKSTNGLIDRDVVATTLFLATADGDYSSLNATFTIPPGQQNEICTGVSISPDDILESNETFSISLTSDQPGVVIGSGETVITIIDDDGR